MKCPLLQRYLIEGENEALEVFDDCLKADCAWWEQDLNLCAIKEIALELRYTQLRLADIIEKRSRKGEGDPQ